MDSQGYSKFCQTLDNTSANSTRSGNASATLVMLNPSDRWNADHETRMLLLYLVRFTIYVFLVRKFEAVSTCPIILTYAFNNFFVRHC